MKGHVLLVEDDVRVRHIYAYFLAQGGYKVTEGYSVATGLMHLDILDLSVVVLDLWLPNGHGKEIVDALEAKRNDVPVVILSASPDEYEWQWPVVGVLKKPAPREVFLREVNHAQYLYNEGVKKLRETARKLRSLTEAKI